LIFASSIEATLGREGLRVVTVETLSELRTLVGEEVPGVVILDLHAGIEATDVVAMAKPAPVIAFGRHTEPALLRSAREAGCIASVARSTFVEEMTAIVQRAASPSTDD
jgi:DNA-binding NtrC family response regulator